MRDLIRNYRLLLKGKSNNDSDSEIESQPLMSSASSSSSPTASHFRAARNFGSTRTKLQDDGDESLDSLSESKNFSNFLSVPDRIPSILLQKKQNRKLLFNCYHDGGNNDEELLAESFRSDGNDLFISKSLASSSTACLFREDGPNEAQEEKPASTNSSLVTIFAIWNTTVGTSLLSMAWGIEKAGLFPAILINLFIAAICLYTTLTLLRINAKHGLPQQEVCDLCRALIGQWAEILAKIFSLVVLIGANIVYWILMANFLYNSILFFYSILFADQVSTTVNNLTVLCPKNDSIFVNQTAAAVETQGFLKFWDLYSTVPVILGLIMFPMLNWKSATFFTKFNSLGTLSVLYLIVFVAIKAFEWGGVNLQMQIGELFTLKSTFCALSGMLSLSYFIHNIIISIMRNNRDQRRNGRDLTIAFALITFTYLFIGIGFYVSFPLPKYCIEDNILNNFNKSDLLTIIARILLLFQLFTVFPLISFMLRNDIFANINLIWKNSNFNFTYPRVIVLNFGIVTTCILFACYLPRIGTLIRYTGALSGMVYIFMLPSLLKIASLRKEGNLTGPQLIFHVSVIILGVINLMLQFFISD